MSRLYYRLTKPGIIYGNTLVAFAGFIYASHVAIDWLLCLWTLLGLALVIASACVFNNYLDRGIDAKMERTKERALVTKQIDTTHALMFGTALVVLGSVMLFVFTNIAAFTVALTGFVVYVFMYSPLKPHTPYALFVGAVAGATPPVVGYAAVTHAVDLNSAYLFLFLFVWQLPHFLAIAVYRNEEYAAAGVPLFVHGPFTEKQKKIGKIVFYLSLVVLLAWCGALILHR